MRNILLIEDDSVTAEIVGDTLSTAGFTIHHATSMEEARVKHKEQSMDLLIIDLNLPDGDGFDLAKEFRKNKPCPPFVFMTSRTDIEDVRKGFEAGGRDYIKKPFDQEELLLRIHQVLGDFNSDKSQDRQIGLYYFNPNTQTLTYKNEYVILGRLQSAVLDDLSAPIGSIVYKTYLLEKYWEGATYFTSRNLDSVIVKLRERFKQDSSVHFLALKKVGYRLVLL